MVDVMRVMLSRPLDVHGLRRGGILIRYSNFTGRKDLIWHFRHDDDFYDDASQESPK